MNILAFESSCDETAVAVFDPSRGLVGEWVHSQIVLHGRHGGVVPTWPPANTCAISRRFWRAPRCSLSGLRWTPSR